MGCTGGEGYRSPLTSRDDHPLSGYVFYVNPDDRWEFWVGDGSYWTGVLGPPAEIGVWSTLRGTFDAIAMAVHFHVNGALAGTKTSVTFMPNERQPLRLGAGRSERETPLFFFTGEVGDVAVK